MIPIHIGIDIGGSHVGIGLVNEDGTLEAKKDLYYLKGSFDIESSFAVINDFIAKYEERSESIGIGIPGFATDTLVQYTCNLPLENVELMDYLKTKLPVFVSNDANCAAIAEYELMDKKMYSNYLFVTVGTGIGCGMILNGSLYIGNKGTAGEIGHMVIDRDGLKCNCGRRGCFEKYASISALLKMTDTESLKEVFYLAEKNQKIQNVLEQYLENLAEGLANVINLYDPEMLVIGGGLSEFEDKFMPGLKAKLLPKLYNQCTYDWNIKVASLKNDAGMIGASMLGKYLSEK